ncbi:hypothetical protein [Bowmanella sp. JS7-9]|uniref:PEP-CTERM protein-sorting domain-containing protein n=1 Tax=Pseudobowmanella zhangzhouensis TaxID=1537679 RepID=A0ABW1XKD4_9ALTE|nr:hypothetical protein [Bowmanella sp. JS7-9]TBX27254.1 hypothetical protein TK45_00425 [Bowmanella sp. JS7-9]
MALITVTDDTMNCYKADNEQIYTGSNGGQISICSYDDSGEGVKDSIVLNIDSSIPIDLAGFDFQDSSLSEFFNFYTSQGDSWDFSKSGTYGVFSAPVNQDLQNVTFEMRLKELFKNNYKIGDFSQNSTPWIIGDQNNRINEIYSMPFYNIEQIQVNQVPEPSAAALMGAAILASLAVKTLFRR